MIPLILVDMKKLFLFSIAACLSAVVSAQKVYFIYLQTDDQSPFYVRMSDKIFSSAVSGFLILPNLTDSTYNLNIGFAKSTKPEIKFAVTVNQNDKGYLIKAFDDGLALFNMQDLSIVKANNGNKDNTAFETRSDKFSSILSKAADDPGLLKVAVVKKEEEPKVKAEQKETAIAKKEEIKNVEEKPKNTVADKPIETIQVKADNKEQSQKADTTVFEPVTKPNEEVKQPTIKEELQNAIQTEDYKPSVVTRYSESSTTEGFGIVYFDKLNGAIDTIRILIPSSKNKFAQEPDALNLSEMEKTPGITITDSSQPKVDLRTDVKKEDVEKVAVTTSSCSATASEKDFMKLRKNMAAKSSDEDMITEAKKSFKNKCFTSVQMYVSLSFHQI